MIHGQMSNDSNGGSGLLEALGFVSLVSLLGRSIEFAHDFLMILLKKTLPISSRYMQDLVDDMKESIRM